MRKLLIAATAVVLAAAGAIATAEGSGIGGASGNQLAGTWTITLHRPAPLPPLTSLTAFTDSGSFIEWANDGSSRSPQFGSWSRVEGHTYASSGRFFRFHPQTDALLGDLTTVRRLELSQDGQSFTAVGRATLHDVNGNVISTFPVTATGERMPVETLP